MFLSTGSMMSRERLSPHKLGLCMLLQVTRALCTPRPRSARLTLRAPCQIYVFPNMNSSPDVEDDANELSLSLDKRAIQMLAMYARPKFRHRLALRLRHVASAAGTSPRRSSRWTRRRRRSGSRSS